MWNKLRIVLVALLLLAPFTTYAAIGFDTGATASANCPAASFSSGNVSASATLGIVFLTFNNLTDSGSTVLWGASSASLIARYSAVGTNGMEVWGVLNPPSGVSTVAITCTGVVSNILFAHSYTGTDSTTLPSNTSAIGQTSGTSISRAITTAKDNSWVVNVQYQQSSNTSAYTAGATRRCGNNGCAGEGSSRITGDSNAAITPAGSNTTSVSWTGSANNGIMEVEIFVPQAAATVPKYGYYAINWW